MGFEMPHHLARHFESCENILKNRQMPGINLSNNKNEQTQPLNQNKIIKNSNQTEDNKNDNI